MFKTALKIEIRNTQRNAYTPIAKMSKRVKITLNPQAVQQQQQDSRLTRLRPMTTPLIEPKNFSTLNQSTYNSHFVNMRSIGAVETELEQTYKGEMCGYLRKKLRRLVDKKKEEISYSRYLQETIDNDMQSTIKSSTVGPLDQFYSTFKRGNQLKIEKGIDEAYLCNAKERISRLIEMKRQTQKHFSQLKGSVKMTMLQRDQRKGKSNRDHFRVQSVDEQEWDREWRQSSRRQEKRYRNRLLNKHNRNTLTLTLK